MPRVSDEHLASRRRQILDAARRRFAANGFHATSMQDLLAECGLSAGAVYRYFPSKDAMVAAIAEEAMLAIRGAFAADLEELSVPEVIERAIAAVDARARQDDLGRLALQVWAEAARSDALREQLARFVRETRELLSAHVARRHPEADADAVAAVLVALLPGYCHALVIAGDITVEGYLRGLGDLGGVLTASVATVQRAS